MNLKKIAVILTIGLFTAGCMTPLHNSVSPTDRRTDPKATEHLIRAVIFELQDDYESAVSQLIEALKYAPDSAAICEALSRDYFILGKQKDAKRFAERALQLDPELVGLHRLLAELSQIEGDFASAARHLEMAVKMDQKDDRSLDRLVYLYLRMNQPEKAIRFLVQLSESKDSLPEVRLKLARIYLGLGRWEEARSCYREMLSLDPRSENAWLGLGMVLESEEEDEQAISTYKKALEVLPLSVSLRRRLGQLYMSTGRTAEAITQLKQAYELSPDDFGVLKNLLQLYKTTGGQRELTDLVDTLRAEAGKDADFLYHLGSILLEIDEFTFAADIFQKVIATAGYGWVGAGYALLLSRDYERATQTLLEAAELATENPRVFYLLGASLRKQERWFEAISAFRRAVELEPQDSELLFHLASSLEQAGLFDEAVRTFEEVLRINPDDAFALNYLGYILADQGIRLDESVEMLKKAVAIEPKNGAFLDSLGWAYYRVGKLHEAEKWLTKALRFEKENAVIFDHLGDVYYALDKLEKAKLQWEESLRLQPDNLKVKEKLDSLGPD
ncbi:MAG TPA: tetratricopeptide repeat protein [Candidatus Latescibacteria bacterium]|nr:tetratricopeptide repeat protein [Candidatus Latescibacterota bacterium]